MNEDFWITYPVIPIDYGPTIEKTTAKVVYSSDDTSRQAPRKTYQQAPLPERMCPIGDEQGRRNATSCPESVYPLRRDVNQGYNNIIEEAIAMVNASNCDSKDFWKTMRMDPSIKNREMTNSHLRPTGKILNEGTPWSCYEFVDTRLEQTNPTKKSLINKTPKTTTNQEQPWDVFEFLDDRKYPRQVIADKNATHSLKNGVLVLEEPPHDNKSSSIHESSPTQGRYDNSVTMQRVAMKKPQDVSIANYVPKEPSLPLDTVVKHKNNERLLNKNLVKEKFKIPLNSHLCERYIDHHSPRRTIRSSGCNKRQFCVTASTKKNFQTHELSRF